MNQLLGKARPGMQMNDIMNELGFKPETHERQRFFDDLRSFHQDPRHPHRLSLKTTVNASLVDEEFLNFMRRFGDDYFGPQYRSHLKPTARIFIRGTSDVCIFEDFMAVRKALLILSRNYEKRLKARRLSRLSRVSHTSQGGQHHIESSPPEDTLYTPSSERSGSETSQVTGSLHTDKSTDSERIPPPTRAERSELSLKPSQSLEQDTCRTTAAKATDQSPTAEPWDASGCSVDWENVQLETQRPTNSHPKLHYPTRSSATNTTTTSKQRSSKRKLEDHGDTPTPTRSGVCLRPRSAAEDMAMHKTRKPSIQQPSLEVHFCVPNARKAFEKWPHGGFRTHTIDTFFQKVYESCGSRGHLTAVTFTLLEAVPARTWKVEEGQAMMFEHVKEMTRRILTEGKYVGIFEILMEPTMEEEEEDDDDVSGTIVHDV